MKTIILSGNDLRGLRAERGSLAPGILSASVSRWRRCLLGCAFCWLPLTSLHAAGTFEVIKTLTGATSGAHPTAALMQATDGALYGTAAHGGSYNYGTVFRMNPDGTGFSVLKHFDLSPSGAYPNSELIQGAGGALYGTASQGGSGGTLFRINMDGSGFTVLKHFDHHTTGSHLYGGLMQGTDGALYGTAYLGGTYSDGTVYKINPDGTGFSVLKHFDYDTTGANPHGGLIQGADGALYGTAEWGGSHVFGTVFKLNTDGSGFVVLKNFDALTTGGYLKARLTQAMDGALYGTAGGGSNGYGAVFKLNTDGTGFSVIKHFDYYTTGAYPQSSRLIQGADGALYSTSYYGGSHDLGLVFRLNPDGSDFSVVFNFDGSTTGARPFAGLIRGTDGAFYGTVQYGGSNGYGTVYRLSLNSPPLASAGADFSVNEGQLAALNGSLSSDSDGDALTYAWTQVPGGTVVTLSDATAQQPTFTAPGVPLGGETLSFELTVTAGGESSKDTVSITVVNLNHPPVAEAGPDQSVAEGSPVTLYGVNSFDIDNDSFTFSWVQVENGSPAVTLTGASTANPGFTAPIVDTDGAPGVVATLVFELRVDDGHPQDAPAPGFTFENVVDRITVEVTNVNNDPAAAAGADQTVAENSVVALNGVASSDPDSDALDFAWTQTSGPAVALTDITTATPGFTAPFVGAGGADLEFELTVDDGYSGIDTDTVVVHVQNINDPPLTSAAQPTLATLWPPNHGLINVGITGVSDPNNNATITITGVTQDEPTSGLGDGDTPVDAVINADGTVLLRAERSGTGDGRVYRIAFKASDVEGSSTGVVIVKVPHSVKKPAIDSDGTFPSTE